MANGAFTCKGCKTGYNAKGFFTGVSDKYKCPKHGEFCRDCMSKRFFGASVCSKCDAKVVRYEYKDSYGKWMKA